MVDFTIISVVVTLLAVISMSVVSKSTSLGLLSGVLVFGWIAVTTEQTFMLGGWFLILVFIAIGTGRFLTRLVIGDVS